MKKTNSFLLFLATVSILLLPSCGAIQGPDNWMVEIEDDFRMQIASTIYYGSYDEKLVDDLLEKIEKLATEKYEESSATDFARYKAALEELSKDDVWANDIYLCYSNIKCNFSDFSEMPQEDGYSVWQGKETNSNITITFKINKQLEWSLDLNEEELISYASLLLQGITDALSTPAGIEAIITKTAEITYKGMIDDEDVMTPDFYNELHQAMSITGDVDSWAKHGYWKFGNGSTHSFNISKVEDCDSEYPSVYMTLDGSKEIAVVFQKIDEQWRISDVVGIEYGAVGYSLWDFATVEVAEHNSDHEGN